MVAVQHRARLQRAPQLETSDVVLLRHEPALAVLVAVGELGLARDRLVRVCPVAEDHPLLRGVLEEVEDPLFCAEPRHEREVGLLVLHAVGALWVLARQRLAVRHAGVVEHGRHDLGHALVLEDAARLALAEQPKPRHHAQPERVPAVVEGGLGLDRGDDAVQRARVAAGHVQGEGSALAEEPGCEVVRVAAGGRDHDVEAEGARDALSAAEGEDAQAALRERARGEPERRAGRTGGRRGGGRRVG